jgi:TolB-like protein/Flp pilus assembly protein TadD
VEVASVEKMAFPLPDKPSIAVLPFDNLSGDPDQNYIADGITENIISSLSKISEMFVIARNSTFTYKGKPVKIQQVAEELGVRNVLEGSVQKSGSKLRITAQLIDATTGHHLWSERYDKDLEDLFDLQDEITKEIVVGLQVELTEGEQAQIRHRSTNNLQAWGYAIKGYRLFERYTKGDNAKARELFEKAIKLDPEYAWAWTWLAWTHWIDVRFGYSKSRAESFKRAVEIAQKAVALDETDPDVHALLGGIYLAQRQHEKALAEGKRAVDLGPNSAEVHALLAMSMLHSGEFEGGIAAAEKSMRLSPHYPSWYLLALGAPKLFLGRYEEALEAFKRCLELSKKEGGAILILSHLYLAATYSELGREKEARTHIEEILKINAKFSSEWVRKAAFYKNPEHLQRWLAALRRAGLPDKPPLPLPDKPSIAILPFTNMSDDPKQEYFTDGITEDIITSLSKTDRLFVIARSSSFTYKGKPVKVQQVGRELGIKYVLEGSVRKDENRLRITAQLIDATTGNHLWAERYDRELKDIFVLQDEINMKILSALQIKLTHGEQARIWAKGTDNLEAYLKLMQAHENFIKMNIEGNALARQMAGETITLDPKYADAYSLLGKTHMMDMFLGTSKSPRNSLAQAMELLQKAIALDDSSADARSRLGILYTMMRQHDKGIAEIERATALNPNLAFSHFRLGWALRFAGRPEEAIPAIKKAMRLNPYPPNSYLWSLATCYLYTGKCEEAIETCEKILQGEIDSHLSYIVATVVYSMCGKEEKARETAEGVLKMNPKFSCTYFARSLPYKNKDDLDRYMAALKKAGLK